jgi:peptidoglycan hydrolase-like protein with peptidoglycan-binding domain
MTRRSFDEVILVLGGLIREGIQLRVAFVSAGFLYLSIACAFGQTTTASQIRILQEALVWTTDYEGLIDGKLGPETAKAIINFQTRIGDTPSGVLTQVETQRLLLEGNANKDRSGFKQVTDSNVGVSVGIPLTLLNTPTHTKWGKHWESPKTGLSIDLLRFNADVSLKDLHDKLVSINNRTISYDRFVDNDWFVIAAFEGDAAVYVRANVVQLPNLPSEIRGFSIWMSKYRPKGYQAIPPAMLSSFRSNTDARTDALPVPLNVGGPFLPPPPSLPVNPPPGRPLETTGAAAPVGSCFKGLGDCPPILNAFK